MYSFPQKKKKKQRMIFTNCGKGEKKWEEAEHKMLQIKFMSATQ